MATTIEYALMAGASYISTRADINKFPIPQGWTSVIDPPHFKDDVTGFEAVAFTNGTEIVISFAGTGGDGDWFHGNVPLALGMLPDQLRQAADYYLQVKASAPVNTTITFTGHSLGGGLASLMAVMFGGSATTFDQAPFRSAAESYATLDNGNLITRSVAQDLLAYLQGETVNGQPGYTVDQLQSLASYVNAADAAIGTVPNEANVNNINVQDEILSDPPVSMFSRIGTSQSDLEQQNNMPVITGNISLHSQALLTAMLQSGDTATSTSADHTLGQASVKLTDLLKMIFDENLFAHTTAATNTTDPNFIEHLVRHQTGGVAGVQGGGDAMVTRFTSDLWKIAQDGGLSLTDTNLADALTAFAMQKYYEENDPNVCYGAELFTDIATEGGSNGIRFDMHDVSKDIAAQMDSTDPAVRVDLAATRDGKLLLKGYEYFQNYLNGGDTVAGDNTYPTGPLSLAERAMIQSMISSLRDWYVQAGSGGMTAIDTQNRGAFMLGGSSGDALTGGAAADLLAGNAGDDLMRGGQGSDVLLGGSGNDAYIYTTGDGLDTILDSDGQGSIAMDGANLAGGEQYGDSRVHRDADGRLYVDVGGDRLVIDGNILIEGQQEGELGITLGGPDAAAADPVTTRDIVGDINPTDINPDLDGVQAKPDALYNPVGTTQAYEDSLFGSPGNDHILLGEMQDWVSGGSGADWIEGGNGNDYLIGGNSLERYQLGVVAGDNYIDGNDLIEGGAGKRFWQLNAANDIEYQIRPARRAA
ncbi:MAG: hypothetical protein HZB95_08165 [Nitrosomonadales bacterium]|nr:hypothetical protein [Nitrosomonadales bacterium]